MKRGRSGKARCDRPLNLRYASWSRVVVPSVTHPALRASCWRARLCSSAYSAAKRASFADGSSPSARAPGAGRPWDGGESGSSTFGALDVSTRPPCPRTNPVTIVLAMGVLLTPIIVKETLTLADLAGRRVAVDGNGELYQFLALI